MPKEVSGQFFRHCLGKIKPGLRNEVGGNFTFFSPKVAGLFLILRCQFLLYFRVFSFEKLELVTIPILTNFELRQGKISFQRGWSVVLKFAQIAFQIKCFCLLSLLWYRRYLYGVMIKHQKLHFRPQGHDESLRHI